MYTIDYPSVYFYNIYIEGQDNVNEKSSALFFGQFEQDVAITAGMRCERVTKGMFVVDNYVLKQKVSFGVARQGIYNSVDVNVSKASVLADTVVAFSGVNKLSDSINVGKCDEWGATKSEKCIDAGENASSYSHGDVTSSIVLYPTANNEYYYYSAVGEQLSLVDSALITKDFFVSFLGFDETIWNLDDIDVQKGLYPTIRK